MMKKIILFGFISLLISATTNAQKSEGSTYQTAIGVAVWPGAITLKHFIQENRAVEGLAYFWEDWGKRSTPRERMEKEEIDLKYQEKKADVDYKKQKASREGYEKAQKKQKDLEHKKEKLEIYSIPSFKKVKLSFWSFLNF